MSSPPRAPRLRGLQFNGGGLSPSVLPSLRSEADSHTLVRLLLVSNGTDASTSSGSSSSNANETSSTMFIAIIVGLVCLFYVICTYQCLRLWLCHKFFGRRGDASAVPPSSAQEDTNNATLLLHEGRVFNLNGDQRRQVLEVIFSETSKPATDSDVSRSPKKKKKKRNRTQTRFDEDGGDEGRELDKGETDPRSDEDDDSDFDPGVPLNVRIPGVATAATEASSDGAASPASSRGRTSTVVYDEDRSLSSSMEDEGSVELCTSSKCVENDRACSLDPGEETTIRSAADENIADTQPPPPPDLEEPQTPTRFVATAEDSLNSCCRTATLAHNDDTVVVSTPLMDPPRVDLAQDLTPRASSQSQNSQTEPIVHNLSVVSLEDSSVSASARAPTTLPTSTSGPLRPALGDDTAILQTMLTLPNFRPTATPSRTARHNTRHAIPEHEAVDETKEEVQPLPDHPLTSGHNDVAQSPSLSFDPDEDPDNYLRSLQLPIPLVRRESYTTVTSEYTYDDDSTTGDNVCPICLCGYKVGDVLVSSKYCVHVFHKDCILEWLDKNNNCPVCRIDMVTDSEMNRAATSLVGKTRMVRAVASLQPAPALHHRALPPSLSPQRSPNQPSPLSGTIRRGAAGHVYW